MSFILHLKLLVLLFQNHVFCFGFLHLLELDASIIPNGTEIFFANGTATFINGPAILLNNEPKKQPA